MGHLDGQRLSVTFLDRLMNDLNHMSSLGCRSRITSSVFRLTTLPRLVTDTPIT